MNDKKNKQPQQGNRQDNQKQGHQQKKQDQDKHPMKGGIEQPDQPEKKTQINDNPDETKKKIPNMQDKH